MRWMCPAWREMEEARRCRRRADVPGADLVIACTSTDEMNLFCCLLARRLGAKQTIARVRNPVYAEQMHLLKEDLKAEHGGQPGASPWRGRSPGC